MDVVYALAGLIGVAGVLFAAVNIIYPIKRLGIPTRKRAVLVLIASFSLAIVAAALDEPAEQSDQSVEVQPPPGGVADEANTVADNSASKTTNKVSAADPTPDESSRTGSVSSKPIQDGQTDSSSTSRNTIDSRVYTVVAEKDHSFGNVRSRVTLEIEAHGATTKRAQIETMMKAAVERHRKDWPDAVSVRLWVSYAADQAITNSNDYADDGCGWAGDDCTGRIWAKPHKGNVPAELTEWGTPTDEEREASKDLQSVAQALTPFTCEERPFFTLSYDAPVQVRRIAKDTVEKMGMHVGPLDALPANKKRSWYFSSSGPSALSVLSRGEDWTWFTDGDTVKFRKRDDIKGLVIYEVLDVRPRLEEGKLVLDLDTDLPDEAEVTVEIYRSYEAKGQDGRSETYSHKYFRECGTVARWKANETIPIDEAAWGRALKEHQDEMGRLGKDMAFEIVAINDHITVSASGGISTAIGSSLQRLTDEDHVLKPREALAGQSLHVSWDALEVGRAYRFLKTGVPLMPRRGVDGKLMGTMVRLTDKAVVVVQAVEDSVPNSFWYLVSADGQWGWVNGAAFLKSGAVRIPSRGEQDPEQLRYRREIAEHVLKPCLSRAYEKAVRSNAVQQSNSMKSEMMRAMIDASHGMFAEFITEMTDLELGLLPVADRMAFYRKSRDHCISGT